MGSRLKWEPGLGWGAGKGVKMAPSCPRDFCRRCQLHQVRPPANWAAVSDTELTPPAAVGWDGGAALPGRACCFVSLPDGSS